MDQALDLGPVVGLGQELLAHLPAEWSGLNLEAVNVPSRDLWSKL